MITAVPVISDSKVENKVHITTRVKSKSLGRQDGYPSNGTSELQSNLGEE